MGQTISSILENNSEISIGAGVSIDDNIKCNYPVYKNIYDCNQDFDIIVDFSNTHALNSLLSYATEKNKPLFIATTGHSPQQIEKIHLSSKQIPIFFTANTSLGISLLLELAKMAVKVLSDDFDIEIIEKHHNQKVDAPSGTALTIADIINKVSSEKYDYIYDRHNDGKRRSKNEIGIHSIRGGTYPGEHTVIFAGDDEILEIKHTALSKKVFANGAIRIIKFIKDKPVGLYSMKDIIM